MSCWYLEPDRDGVNIHPDNISILHSVCERYVDIWIAIFTR